MRPSSFITGALCGLAVGGSAAFFFGKRDVEPTLLTPPAPILANQAPKPQPPKAEPQKAEPMRQEFKIEHVRKYLAGLDAAQLEECGRGLRGEDRLSRAALETIVARLGKLDPMRALAFAQGFPLDQKNALTAIVANSWSSVDPQACLSWIKSLKGGPKQTFLTAAIMGWGDKDPKAAAEYLCAQQFNSSSYFGGFSQLATKLGEVDPSYGISWAQKLPLGFQGQALDLVFVGYAKVDPAAALTRGLNPDHSNPANPGTEAVLKTWALSDPASCAAFIGALPADEIASLSDAARSAAAHDAIAFQNIASRLGAYGSSHSNDDALKGLLYADPKYALEWVNAAPPTAITGQGMRNAIDGVLMYDREGALDWVQGVTDPTLRDNAVAAVVATFANRDPEIASMALETIKNPELKAELARHIPRPLKR